jgi:anti-sigma factor RsiW
MKAEHEPMTGTLEAGQLLRYLHDELEQDERGAVRAHVAACNACRTRLATLSRGSRDASALLAAADFEAPGEAEWRAMRERVLRGRTARAPDPRLLRLAASVALLLGTVVVLQATAAGDWLREQWQAFTTAEPLPVAPASGSAAVAFRPAVEVLQVRLDERPAAGVLQVRFAQSDTARLTVLDGGTEALVVESNGVRIANTTAAAASYELVVPRGVQRVAVAVGARAAVELDRADVVIELELNSGLVRKPPARGNH